MRTESLARRLMPSLAGALLLGLGVSAGIVETQDERSYEGQVRLDGDGTFTVQTTNGSVVKVALDQVRLARLRPAPALGGSLPGGWRLEDIGQVQGAADEKDGLFELRASGGAIRDPKKQAVHFVHRVLRGDGEMAARVEKVSGPESCLAGVMLRENLESAGGFVLLAVTPDHRLRFDSREQGWHALNQLDLGPVQLPLWLKLVWEGNEKTVTASRSADGTDWEPVARSALGCRVEAFPQGSDYWKPKIFSGLAVTGSGTETAAESQFDQVTLTAYGLLGEYFRDSRLKELWFSRPDDKVEFYWGQGSPSPGIPEDHFSVRWTGQVEPMFSENYRFYVEADNDAWLWVNDQQLPSVGFSRREAKAVELPLQAHQKYSLKLEFKEGAGAASLRLGWSSPSQPVQVIPAGRLSYTYQAQSPDELASENTTNGFFARGVWLRNGSFLGGSIDSADDTATRLAFAGQDEFAISTFNVAHMVLRNHRGALPLEAAQGQAGVLLKNGDFLDGDLERMDGRSLTLGSVLFGPRTFSLENDEVIALLLHPPSPTPAPFEVRLANGSVLRVKSLRAAGESVRVEDTTLGQIAIPLGDLVEIRNLTAGH